MGTVTFLFAQKSADFAVELDIKRTNGDSHVSF
jgi:hypothetical protein